MPPLCARGGRDPAMRVAQLDLGSGGLTPSPHRVTLRARLDGTRPEHAVHPDHNQVKDGKRRNEAVDARRTGRPL
ncbi:hypothetical protein GCM10010321_01960 [Streptomyces chartreusis]|nr:hypothetical protein GCM10010321_01960 [Streptomyces chartreusis]